MPYVFAQDNNCVEKEAQFSSSLTNKNYDVASALWKDISRNCAQFNENIYALGSEILNYNIEVSPPEKKEANVKELLKMYQNYDKYFPNNKNANDVKSAMVLYKNKMGTDQEIFNYLDKAYNNQKETFLNSQAIYVYFYLYYKKFKEENTTITIEQVIDKYNLVNALAIDASKVNSSSSEEYERVKMATKALMYTSLKCEDLESYFQNKYETNKENTSWLLTSLNTMSAKCKNTKAFQKLAQQYHILNPSSASNYFLGEYFLVSRDQTVALSYFDQSVALAIDGLDKAKKAYAIASILANSNKEKSKKMISLAIENDKNNGRYHMFLANLYFNGVNDCAAANEEQTNAIYKLASKTAEKAGKAEPNLLQASTKLAADYLKKATAVGKGKLVKIDCWINETVQL